MIPPRALLWIDDEGPGRFEYAARRLTREGWTITWARSVADGARALREAGFVAVVIDQMLPLTDDTRDATVWGGCALYRWLRRKPLPVGAPANVMTPTGEPLAANVGLPVAIVSAYRHDEVEAAVQEATPAGAKLIYMGKPLDLEALRVAIRGGVS